MKVLRDSLRDKFPGRVHHVPILATQLGNNGTQEYSQRTRSFLYAALGTVVAETFEARQIALFENGIVSLHLPISDQVIGARATRTTHPAFLQGFNKLIGLTTGQGLSIENPFIWQTKAEVVQRLIAAGGRNLIEHAISCSSVLKRKTKSHCGCCSQCIDRRFAELQSGVDLPQIYAVDLLTGERQPGPEQTMAESYVRTYQEIDQAAEMAFFTNYSGPITEVLNTHPSRERESVAKLIFKLHKRQASTVMEVLTNGIQRYSGEIARGQLNSSCVLMLAAASGDLPSGTMDQELARPVILEQVHATELTEKEYSPVDPAAPIVLLISNNNKFVTIKDCTDLGRRSSNLILALKTAYDEALRKQLPMEQYPPSSVEDLTSRLQVSDGSLRHQVAQLRKDHREAAQIHELIWSKDAVIQNIHRRGYRLNPGVRFEKVD